MAVKGVHCVVLACLFAGIEGASRHFFASNETAKTVSEETVGSAGRVTGLAGATGGVTGSACVCKPFSQYDWKSLDEAKELAKDQNKPVLVFIHQGWCSMCSKLKSQMDGAKDFEEISSKFILVDGGNSNEPSGSEFKPDGEYYPRVFFLSPSGKMENVQVNDGSYKYFPSSIFSLVTAMKEALKLTEAESNQSQARNTPDHQMTT